MASGWIKLHRKTVGWEWYTNVPVFKLFVHLLIVANHEEKKWQGLTIRRGQVLSSRAKLAKETGLTEQNIRTAITKLISTKDITIETTKDFKTGRHLISIVNYEKYQVVNQENTDNSTSDQPRTNHELTTTKELKEYKNEEEVVTTDDPFFEMFRRVANKSITDQMLLDEIAKFKNKYPQHTPKKSGALINGWVARMGTEVKQSTGIKTSSFV